MHPTFHHRWTLATGLAIALAALGATGCQRQAYTDFYTESMAGEIRELEDRIYEYDAAYQSIEQELAVLQSENESLHQKLMAAQSTGLRNRPSLAPDSSWSSDSEVLSFPPASSSSEKPRQETGIPKEIPSVDNLPTPPSTTPKTQPTPATKATAPTRSSPPSSKPGPSSSFDASPPVIEPGTPSSTLPSTLAPRDNAPAFGLPDSSLPRTQVPNSNAPTASPGMTLPSPAPTTPATPNSGLDAIPMPSEFKAPSPGTSPPPATTSPSAPGMILPPGLNQSSQALPKELDDRAIADGKIELPGDIVPATFTAPANTPGSKAKANAALDSKVVEIAFHPTLCRGHNFDQDADDDGLYLVLQPRNQSGEIVDLPAAVTIVAVDLKRGEDESRIARWTRSVQEIEASHEPIGLSHGYHLALPWQEIEPTGSSVQVYVRYEMPDGRKLINEKAIQLHRVEAGSNVWTPRVAR